MASTSHRNIFTGILDKEGNKIYNGSKVQVHDNPIHKNNKGIVIWKNGNYQVKGAALDYNVYAWRKKIEVVIPKTKPYFYKNTFEEEWDAFSRTLSIMEKSRDEIKRAFKYAWEVAIESRIK
jgi:hypothetical protein